ncbi:MAG TPA: trypsin-like peptidase domain-containing protein [Chloroflexota bacterium]|nr:trypsin-like peptidase domain-containing protein [Chloroflexota bacterium]
MGTDKEAGSGTLAAVSNELAGAVELAGKSIVAVRARRHVAAAGIVWGPGVVVTADHVIQHEEDITLVLPSGQEVKATLAGRDAGTDLAVLRVDHADLTPASIGDSAALRVGQLALAVGRPGGAGLSASLGIVSAISGSWRTWKGGTVDALIKVDLTLYPGFSGGPLVDATGRVVGLNTSGLSRGTALAIPTSTIARVSAALLARGRISRGYLGVGLQPVRLPEELARGLSLSQGGGLMLISVEEKGPGANGGLLLGDILITLGEKAVDDTNQVQDQLGPESVGVGIAARVIRGGALHAVTLTIGERQETRR